MLPPTFLVTGKVIQSSVLPKLGRVAGVKSCRFCLHRNTVCGCSQISAWSHTSTRQTPATATTTRSHDSTSVSALITCPPPGLLPQGAAAPTSTYSEALVLDQAPPTCMRGVSRPPLPGAGYPSAVTPQDWEEEDPHDIKMKDVEDDPNLPPPSEQDDDPLPVPVQAAQSDQPWRQRRPGGCERQQGHNYRGQKNHCQGWRCYSNHTGRRPTPG